MPQLSLVLVRLIARLKILMQFILVVPRLKILIARLIAIKIFNRSAAPVEIKSKSNHMFPNHIFRTKTKSTRMIQSQFKSNHGLDLPITGRYKLRGFV